MKALKPFRIKKAVIIAALLYQFIPSIFANPSTECNYTWVLQTSGTAQTLYSVEAVNESICWAAGANGTVRRTTDGGATWLNGNPNPGIITGNIKNIEAIDANNAWVTTSPGIMTYIYLTTNGGNNWIQVYSQNGGYINGIHMISETNGFAFGDPIAFIWRILVTTNGGLNWTQLATSPLAGSSSQGFNNCFQVTPPYIWFGSYPGQIFRSTNNGINWSFHYTPGIVSVFAIHFNSPSLGFASSISMVKSTDAGSTYISHPTAGLGNINGIEGSGNNLWYLRGTSIYKSTNGGDNWILDYSTTYTQLDIDFPDSINGCLLGWSVGNGGSISKMTEAPVGISSSNNGIPNEYTLEQNYPNPFNPVTTINYSIPKACHVQITLYDVTGKKITGIVDEYKPAGTYSINFDASHLASGMYFYRIEAGDFAAVKKMMLVK